MILTLSSKFPVWNCTRACAELRFQFVRGPLSFFDVESSVFSWSTVRLYC